MMGDAKKRLRALNYAPPIWGHLDNCQRESLSSILGIELSPDVTVRVDCGTGYARLHWTHGEYAYRFDLSDRCFYRRRRQGGEIRERAWMEIEYDT